MEMILIYVVKISVYMYQLLIFVYCPTNKKAVQFYTTEVMN